MDRAGRAAAWSGRIGLGLRVPHVSVLRQNWPAIGFFELLSENFLSAGGVVEGGAPRRTLDAVCERYPVVLHGVGLGIGSPEGLDRDHLRRLKALAKHSGAAWVSDHLCWSRSRGRHLHELMPLPSSLALERLIADRARQVQDTLELPFALENVSAYVSLPGDGRPGLQMLSGIAERADIGVLLDVNNLYVSACNARHGSGPSGQQGREPALSALSAVQQELQATIDPARVIQLHIAGHTVLDDGFLLDTHDHDICGPVEDLLAWVFGWAGPVPLCLERDGRFPSLDETWAQAQRVAAAARRALGPRPTHTRPVVADASEAAAPVDATFALLDAMADAALLPLIRAADGAAVVPVQDYDPALLACLEAAGAPHGRPLPLRLALYTHQVQARLVGVLREELPLTASVLGERAFGDLCLAALAEQPPISPLLRALPAALATALAAPGPRLRAQLGASPVPIDLLYAVWDDDLAWSDAAVEGAGPPLRPEAIDPSALLHGPLRLQPHLRVLTRSWRLLPARRGDGPPTAGPEQVAVLRGRAGVEAVTVSAHQASLLLALGSGLPLAGACAALEAGLASAEREAVGAALPGWFAAWAQAGWFVHPQAPEARAE